MMMMTARLPQVTTAVEKRLRLIKMIKMFHGVEGQGDSRTLQENSIRKQNLSHHGLLEAVEHQHFRSLPQTRRTRVLTSHLPARLLVPLLLILILSSPFTLTPTAARQQTRRQTRKLSTDDIQAIASMTPEPWPEIHTGHLEEMLKVRVSGSEGNRQVREHITKTFTRLGWHLQTDTFTASTPIGEIEFSNLIFTFDPSAGMNVVLSAHYDSKWFAGAPANEFVGATDSAAPCAMLLDLAEFITPSLLARKARQLSDTLTFDDDTDFDEEIASQTSLQIIFFDGEEAFHDWTATDSIYGSRHLATKWDEEYLPHDHAYHSIRSRRMDPNPTTLSTIEHLVLLDLLGSRSPRILSMYKETTWLHEMMRVADERLRKEGLVEKSTGGEWFQHSSWWGTIEDDHVPFIEKGVEVLHVIANPFPPGWHTLKDDAESLDLPTLHRWNLILRIFTMEYLGLRPDLNLVEHTEAKGKRIPSESRYQMMQRSQSQSELSSSDPT